MADPTLQTISDTLAITQQAVEDLKAIIAGHTTELSTHDSEINTLNNPPAAVPPGLLDWFSLGNTITSADPILNTTITGIQSNVTTLFSTTATTTASLSAEVTNRTNADTDLQTSVTNVQTQVTTNLATLTQEISDRSALAASMATQYSTINSRVDGVQADLATETSSANTSITSLNNQVSTINSTLQTVNTQITLLQNIGVDPLAAQASQITTLTTIANNAASATAAETTARQSADTALQASISGVTGSLGALNTNLNTEVNARIAGDASINAQIGTINTTLSSHTGLISSETAARIAADATLTTNVATNTTNIGTNAAAIAAETTRATTAEGTLTTNVATNTANIATNTTNITSNTTAITGLKAHFGVVKDGGGYITSYRINDDSLAAANFNLRNLNNDLRLQNPSYVGKYFPAVVTCSFSPPTTYDTQYGAGASTLFQGTDTNNYTRLVNVYSTLSVGINGSVLYGVDFSTLGNTQRLGQALTTFLVDFDGYTNGQLSLWYRLKNTVGDNTTRWLPVAMAQISMPSPRTYELASGNAVVQISVTTNQVIEFGLCNLTTLDASRSSSNTVIYNGSVSIQAFNLVTIS